MNRTTPGTSIGVLGGLGPLASAEFLRTIYELSLGDHEQDAPAVLMLSDPTFPDRTAALASGREELLVNRLTAALDFLQRSGASPIVICCMTIHHVLPRVPAPLRANVISLVDLLLEGILRRRVPHLMLCTSGTRALGLLESSRLWPRVKPYVVFPSEGDQAAVHDDLLYEIKRKADLDRMAAKVWRWLRRYDVNAFAAGCTELHLLVRHMAATGALPSGGCVDPLELIAARFAASRPLAPLAVSEG